MASVYPGALDSFTNPTSTDNLNTAGVLHDVQHSDANDAIEAIEAELGVAPSGSFASVAAAIAALLNPSKVKAKRTTNQTLTTGTAIMLPLTDEDFDTDGWHDNATNNSRLTCPTGKGGTYLIVAACDFAVNATGVRLVAIMKNTSVKIVEVVLPGSASHVACQVVAMATLAPTDYVEMLVWQNTGGNLAIDATTNFQPSLTAVYVGP